MENWVEAGRPRNDAERLRDFIVDHSVLDVQPRSGRLAPGASAAVAVTYRPLALGRHDLELLLQVLDGKRLRLQITAATVPEVRNAVIWAQVHLTEFRGRWPYRAGETRALFA